MKRFSVIIERELIVYDETPEGAKAKALRHVSAGFDAPATRVAKAVSAKELPETDKVAPIVDRAPAREARK
jgi:hypothetical protein